MNITEHWNALDEHQRKAINLIIERLSGTSLTKDERSPAQIVIAAAMSINGGVDELTRLGRVVVSAMADKMIIGSPFGEPEWIEWNGGSCPVDCNAMVEVKLKEARGPSPRRANQFEWNNSGMLSDIIAYRVIREGEK